MVIRSLALILLLPVVCWGQTYVAGYAGFLSRVQAERLDFFSFRGGPSSTYSPVFSAGAGTSIWKARVDGSVLYTKTGETLVFIGPSREVEETTNGSSIMFEAGAGWPFWNIGGFETLVRVGFGRARTRIPTMIPIENDQNFWTYGFATSRPIGTRYLLRFDVRNVQFPPDEVPPTLGRHNIVFMTGLGLRF